MRPQVVPLLWALLTQPHQPLQLLAALAFESPPASGTSQGLLALAAALELPRQFPRPLQLVASWSQIREAEAQK